MLFRKLLLLLSMGSLTLTLPVQADPWKDESGHGYYKGNKYKGNKHHKNKHKNKHKSRNFVGYAEGYADQGPPPWAPAHGRRNKHRDYERDHDSHEITYRVPVTDPVPMEEHDTSVEFETINKKIGIDAGKCNRETIGAVMGGIVGGLIGNKTASRKNRTMATIAGSLIGVVVGKEIGRNMDKADAQCTNQTLERARTGQAVSWKNPDTGHHYSVTPYETFQQEDGQYCRKFKTVIKSGSDSESYRETACRGADGVWERTP